MHNTKKILLHRQSAGSTMIEVLVTMFLMAIGVLTTLGMQISTKEALYDSVQRTAAAQLAYDMSERLRVNRDARDSYYSGLAAFGGSTQAASVCSTASPCTPAALAAFDLYDWELMLDGAAEVSAAADTGGLVSPQGCITGPAAGGTGQYTIAIAWRGIKKLSDPTINDCGAASGLYGADNEYRRVLTFTLFMS